MAGRNTFTAIIAGDTKKLDQSLKAGEGRMKKFAKAGAVALGGLGLAGAAVAVKLGTDFLKTGDDLHKMSLRVGESVEALSALSFALEQSGSSLDTFEKANQRLNAGLSDLALKGTGPAAEGLEALGLKFEDIEGKDPTERLKIIADAMAGMEDQTAAAAAAQDLFGRSGTELLPLLKEGAEGIQNLTDKARETGNVMSTGTAEAAAKFNDTVNEMKNRLSGLAMKGFNFLLPHIQSFLDLLQDEVFPFIRDNIIPTVKSVAEKLLPALGVAFDVVKTVVKTAIGFLVNDINFIWTTVSGVVDLVTAVASGDWTAAWDAIKGIAEGALDFLVTKVELVWGAIKGIFSAFGVDLEGIVEGVVDKVVGFFTGLPDRLAGIGTAILNALITAINAGTQIINDIIPDKIAIPLAPDIDLPDNPIPRIPHLGRGGIVMPKPGGTLAVLAEAGQPEAVLPLGGPQAAAAGVGVGDTTVHYNLELHIDRPLASPTEIADAVYGALQELEGRGSTRLRVTSG